jgi:hypothetical protein
MPFWNNLNQVRSKSKNLCLLPNVACVSGLSILDRPFGFLYHLYIAKISVIAIRILLQQKVSLFDISTYDQKPKR